MSAAIMLVAASESLPFNYVFFFHFQSAFFELQMVKLDLQENAFCKFKHKCYSQKYFLWWFWKLNVFEFTSITFNQLHQFTEVYSNAFTLFIA